MKISNPRRAPALAAAMLLAAAAALGLAACHPESATPSSADTSPALATVNGVPIRRDFFDYYVKGITGGKSPNDLTADQRALALDNLIRAQLVAQQAEKD